MPQTNLKLFRRHEQNCTAGHPKEFRVYQWMLQKQKGKKATVDCACTIYAEGTLVRNGIKTYLRPKSTEKRIWAEAETLKNNWQNWGDTQAPANVEPEHDGMPVTIQEAAKAFLEKKQDQFNDGKIKKSRHVDVIRFVDRRIAPYATITRRFQFIGELDNEEFWADFKRSWKNERKHDYGEPLGQNTRASYVSNLREFLKFCVKNEWLSDNWASEEYGMSAGQRVTPKEPFSNTELSYIYRAAGEIREGVGINLKTREQTAKENLAFIWTLRYTGLRIVDVAVMETYQLQDFRFAGYTKAIWCNPRKTEDSRDDNFVHIPIPINSNFPNHPDLANALSELTPKQDRYFFKAGTGTDETTRACWQRRLRNIFTRAEKMMEADGLPLRDGTHFGAHLKTAEHPHPHKFRHTFAATLLQGGASLRLVARYLGDTEETVRKHYSKFCREEQEQAAESLATAMKQFDVRTNATTQAKLRRVM